MSTNAGMGASVPTDELTPAELNAVSVRFTDGTFDDFQFVVRIDDSPWLYAERCVEHVQGVSEGERVAINAANVVSIASDAIHLVDGGVVHSDGGCALDVESVLEESWLDGDDCLR